MTFKDFFATLIKPLWLLVILFYFNIVSRVVIAPLLPLLREELNLGYGEAGTLFLFVATGYCLGLFGSGFVSSRLVYRRTIAWSSITAGLALLAMSQFASVWVFSSVSFSSASLRGSIFPRGWPF